MFHSHEYTGTIRPLSDYVLLAPEPVKQKAEIVLTDTKREYRRAKVLAVGPGFRVSNHGVYGPLIPTELKVGEFVFIQEFADGEVPHLRLNGQDVIMVRERHLNLTIEGAVP